MIYHHLPPEAKPDLAPFSTDDELVAGLAKIANRLDEIPERVLLALERGAIPSTVIDGQHVTTASVIEVARRQIAALRQPYRLPGAPVGFSTSASLVR